jgi:Ca-activated chloride channel family protein
MKDKSLSRILILFFILVMFAFIGCSGDDESTSPPPPPPAPSIEVIPSSYSFGSVTPGNSPSPLEVEIQNNGTATLDVSSITLADNTNFSLNLSGGSNPCDNTSPSISAGSKCTVEIAFQPTTDNTFNTNLAISSNDPSAPTFNLPLSGSRVAISALNVRINQLEIACPSGMVTAYVSVTDQGGYPVSGLTRDDFWVNETDNTGLTIGYDNVPVTASFVENSATISTALILDYSTSVTDFPDKVSDMQEGAASFVNQMGVDDEAEIVKFGGSLAEVVQPFTSDNTLLINAINAFWDEGEGTPLFDACKAAADDTALRSKDRKAVIVISDGYENASTIGLNELIDDALSYNVPLFTIGLGDDIDVATLVNMADNTGGQYYEATTSDNLRTVYQQLADVLFSYQYILTYTSGLGAGTTANLTVEATLPGPGTPITGNHTRSITVCP